MNCKHKLSKESYLELYYKGLTDSEIAKTFEMSHCHVSRFRRNILKLPLVQDNIIITKEQEEVLIGTILGDSSILKVHNKMLNNKLTFVHSPKSRSYFFHKVEIFKNLISSYGEYINKSNFGNRTKLVATGRALKCMNLYRDIFYPQGIKIIPINFLKEHFTWKSLAYLFMDDGNRNGKTINLNLQSFTVEDLTLFTKFLKDKFQLEFNIKKDKTLYLTYNSRMTFYNLVGYYVIDEMKYKLDGIKLSLNSVNCLESLEIDNQQPSSCSDTEKGSTTSSESQVDNNSTTKAGQISFKNETDFGIYHERRMLYGI